MKLNLQTVALLMPGVMPFPTAGQPAASRGLYARLRTASHNWGPGPASRQVQSQTPHVPQGLPAQGVKDPLGQSEQAPPPTHTAQQPTSLAARAHGAKLREALNDLEANLVEEQRAISEQHFLVFRLLLSPTQVVTQCCDCTCKSDAILMLDLQGTCWMAVRKGLQTLAVLSFAWVQGGWLVAKMHPHHCDCIGALNAIHAVYGAG